MTNDGPPVVTAIHIAPASRLPVRSVAGAVAEAGKGLVGDRYHGTRHRHVTVQSQEALDAAAADAGAPIDAAGTRRNVTISHGEVPATPGARARIGDVELEVVRRAAPCKLLDDVIGEPARKALVRRAGSVFRVLTSGTIAVGNPVDLAPVEVSDPWRSGPTTAEGAHWRGPDDPGGRPMFRHPVPVPELVPQLSRGKHRNPRKGACFMEMASYLAGERWSDSPSCTHPLLAALARMVNDHTSDEGRDGLLGLVPSVIGLTGDDPHIDLQVMLRAASTALPVVAAERQRVLAVAILAGERALDDLDGRGPGTLSRLSRSALDQVPDAARWARGFVREVGTVPAGARRHGAPGTVRHAVTGIAEACIRDPDALLRDLLATAIADTEALVGATTSPVATLAATPVAGAAPPTQERPTAT